MNKKFINRKDISRTKLKVFKSVYRLVLTYDRESGYLIGQKKEKYKWLKLSM